MNLNTNTKKLTLTKTERGYLAKAKAILLELARIAPAGVLSDASDVAADQICQVEHQLAEPAEVGVV